MSLCAPALWSSAVGSLVWVPDSDVLWEWGGGSLGPSLAIGFQMPETMAPAPLLTCRNPGTSPFLSLSLRFLHWLECSLLGSSSLFCKAGWCGKTEALKPDQHRFKSQLHHCVTGQVLTSPL